MIRPLATERVPGTRFRLQGWVKASLDGITRQWLLVAPLANPGMLEMFRDRDCPPQREMVPWAGEFAGKYLTAAVQVLRLTGDPRLRRWLHEFVGRLIAFQAEDGYLGPWPKDCRLTNRRSDGALTWDTWGHYHVMLGLLLWHEDSGDTGALAAACRIADLLCRKYLGAKQPRLVDTGSTEMNLAPVHALGILYRRTRRQRYLALARQIVAEFAAQGPDGPLAGDYLRQALAGKEFCETPKPRWESLHPILGLAELYRITGRQEYRSAFERLWWSMAKLDRHNNGGFTSGEKATGNPFDLNPIETCCTVAWLAMSAEMLGLTGNSLVADEIELAVLNSVTGMHSPTGRWASYNTPMNGVRRASAHSIVFQAREGTPELNCCSVNAARGFGLLSDVAVMRDADGLMLNWYGAGEMRVPLRPDLTVTLAQSTRYPVSGRVRLRVQPSRPATFALKLRIPQWSQRTRVSLNGKALTGVEPGSYFEVNRRWHVGDSVWIDLDMSLHAWPGERECAGLTALYYGPLLLAFDHRYNLELARDTPPRIRDLDEWKSRLDNVVDVPALDAQDLRMRATAWNDWLPPRLLLEVSAVDGRRVRLCDFGSAGRAGTPYRSWLPVANAPAAVAFSREHPLRSSQLTEGRAKLRKKAQ